jgi:hypothetical protein
VDRGLFFCTARRSKVSPYRGPLPAGTRQREVLAQLYNAFPVLKKLLSQLHLIQVFCFASLPELSGGDFLQLFIEMQQ